MKQLFFSILFFGTIFGSQLKAQSTTVPSPPKKEIVIDANKKQAVQKTTLDTEESFKYIGNQLLFQMKKRLNLTTKEEEEQESKAVKNKKFSFFGIEIEKG